jgi:putative membrane protein
MTDAVPGRMEILALDRTKLAAERTLMAWLRTALSMISFGFTIYKFLQVLQEQSAVLPVRPDAPRNLALVLIGLGTGALVAACFQHVKYIRRLSTTSTPYTPWDLTFVVSCFVTLLGLAAFASIALRAGPLG